MEWQGFATIGSIVIATTYLIVRAIRKYLWNKDASCGGCHSKCQTDLTDSKQTKSNSDLTILN